MCGIMLFKYKKPADLNLVDMANDGTLVIIHKAISDIRTWEGMRLLYNCTPNYEILSEGIFDRIFSNNQYYNKVSWCIIVYKKGGVKGIHYVYNQPYDALLIAPDTIDKCRNILERVI